MNPEAKPENAKDDNTRAAMQAIAQEINERIPTGWGFFCLVFPFNDAAGRMNCVSNARREDIIRNMVEFVDKFKGGNPFGHPIEEHNDTDRIGWISKQVFVLGGPNGPRFSWIGLQDMRSFREEIDKRMSNG